MSNDTSASVVAQSRCHGDRCVCASSSAIASHHPALIVGLPAEMIACTKPVGGRGAALVLKLPSRAEHTRSAADGVNQFEICICKPANSERASHREKRELVVQHGVPQGSFLEPSMFPLLRNGRSVSTSLTSENYLCHSLIEPNNKSTIQILTAINKRVNAIRTYGVRISNCIRRQSCKSFHGHFDRCVVAVHLPQAVVGSLALLMAVAINLSVVMVMYRVSDLIDRPDAICCNLLGYGLPKMIANSEG
ncbi:hypothetical protein J6590_053969 [Homalodisca vitripennis]|nr:hypothetical protein J6590_053969 [Homalodisca vitripennis]